MAATEALARPAGRITPAFRERWGWLLALGIIQIATGLMALVVPAIASFVALGLFAAIMLIAAVFHLAHAFQVRRWSGFAWHLLGGLLYGAAGVVVLLDPLNGVATLMLVIGVLLVLDGVLHVMVGLSVRPADGWGWFVAAGLMSLVLGALLFALWPAAALWIVGTFFAIGLLINGAANTVLAMRCRASRSSEAARASDGTALA